MYNEHWKPSVPGCSFSTAIKNFFGNYATFNGRSSRAEYWWVNLINVLVLTPIYIVFIVIGVIYLDSEIYDSYTGEYHHYLHSDYAAMLSLALFIMLVYDLITFVPNLTLLVRRYHDFGKSGWYVFLGLIPVIGGFITFIYSLQETEEFVNEYGGVYGRDYPKKNKYRYNQVYENPLMNPLASASSVVSELEKYMQLKNQGIITQDEFEKIKKRLLNL